MTRARLAGLAVLAAGIAAGTAVDRRPVRDIPKIGDRYLVAADFHVHATLGDGGLAPWELAREAWRRDLDVIAVTNHNQRLAAVLARTRSGQPPSEPLVLIGQEITAPSFHIAAAGLTQVVDWRFGAAEAIRSVHAQGGVAIAAHPLAPLWQTEPQEALALLDGAEVAHPAVVDSEAGRAELARFFAKAAAVNQSLAPIGSSDFHFGGSLGKCRTYLFVDEITEKGVLDAVRDARTVAFDSHGRLTGGPEHVRAVQDLISRRPPPTRPDGPSRLAAAVALLGLLVVLFA